MDIFETIYTRRSVRKFTQDIPPVEDIKKIIDAARVAPSSTNDQMWKYVVIYNADTKSKMKQAIAEAYEEMLSWKEAEGKEGKINFYKRYSSFLTDAPVNIAVLKEVRYSPMAELLNDRGISHHETARMRPDTGLLSIGASVENLLLATHALGYGACWLVAPLYAYKKLEEIIGVDESYQLVSLLCLGKPENPKAKTTPKKELSEILTIIE